MKGYGWAFRKGDLLNVGLGRADPHGLPSHVATFLKFLKSTGRISFDVPALHGHAYLLEGTSTRQVVGDHVLLAGDAAGLAYPQSGEGIRLAVESGLLAARIIAAADGQYDRQRLETYRARLLDRRQPWLMSAGRVVPPQLVNVLAQSLLKMHWFVRGVVLDRWFLHAASGVD